VYKKEQMLAKINQNLNINAIHERYVYDKAGVLFCVRFTIVNINGVLQPQIISAEPVRKSTKASTTKTVLLANPKVAQPTAFVRNILLNEIVSPFTSLDFLMSQPTRAPSLK
jgi:hypothetical protein